MKSTYLTNLKYRRIDEKEDEWIFGHGENDFLYGIDAMRQVIMTRLKAIAGEWWEGDPTAIPYFDILNGYGATDKRKELIDLIVVERITDTIGVISVSDIVSSIDENRHYSFSCKVKTVYGTTTAEVSA